MVAKRTRAAASLRANVAWAIVGNTGYAACQWAILVVIARLGSDEGLGRFAFALALTGPVMMLANLNLRAVQATDARRQFPFGTYLGLRLLTIGLALAVIVALALGLGYRGGALAVILALALAKGFESVSDVVFGLLQQAEHLRRIALSMIAKGVLSVLAVGGLLYATGSVLTATGGLALAWGVVLVLWDLPAAARLASLRPVVERRALAALAWLALPLGCVMGLNSFTTNVPRYAIEGHLGTVALGQFAAIAYLLVAGTQPILALGAAVSPRLAHHFAHDRAAYRALVRRTVLVSAAVGVLAVEVAAAGGPWLLTRLYGPAYAVHARLLVWMATAAAVAFVASALGVSVTAGRRFRAQLGIAVCALGGCLALVHVLVPRYGLVGAAWAVLATETIRLVTLGGLYVGTRTVGLPLALSVETGDGHAASLGARPG